MRFTVAVVVADLIAALDKGTFRHFTLDQYNQAMFNRISFCG